MVVPTPSAFSEQAPTAPAEPTSDHSPGEASDAAVTIPAVRASALRGDRGGGLAGEEGVVMGEPLEVTGTTMGQGRYEKDKQLGEGTYGVVYKAYDKVTEQTVAIKKIRLGKIKEGVNMTALREIKLLNELKSPTIIDLIDVFPHKRNISLVFEYMESDLEAVITDKAIHLTPGDIKSYMKMTLEGLAFCHANWVVHRDVKPNNLLLAKDGTLKLADFGLARIFGSPPSKLSTQVFARWYRAPELLFGCKSYGGGVDIWAAGCILAELLLRRAFLQGTSDIDQLGRIFAALGTPTEEAWPGMKALPDFVEYQRVPAPPLRSVFPGATDDCLDLISKMLAFDPLRRVTAEDALKHRWFTNPPLPTPPAKLPKPIKREDNPLGLPPGQEPAPPAAAAGPKSSKRDGAGGGGLDRVGSDMNMDMLPPDGARKQPRVSFSPLQGPRRTSFPPPAAPPVREAETRNPVTANATAPRAADVHMMEVRAPNPVTANATAPRAADVPMMEVRARNPVTANATAPRAADVHMMEGYTPGSAMPMSMSGGQMMSTDGEGGSLRPGLNSVDLAYLRKRKLNMDMMFNEASQE